MSSVGASAGGWRRWFSAVPPGSRAAGSGRSCARPAPRARPAAPSRGEQVDAAQLVVVAPVAPGRAVGRCVHRFATGFSFPDDRRLGCNDRFAPNLARRARSMSQKDFVVSADGHILEPTDLFKTRLPSTCATAAVWEEDFEIEPLVEGGARIFRRLHTPGLRGLDDLALPPDRRPHARRRPRAHPRGHGPRRRRRPGHAPEPVAVRAVLRRPRAVDGPRPRLQRLRRRAVRAVLLRAGADRTDPAHRHRRRRRRDRAGRRRRLPGDPAAGHPADALLLARPRPGVGRRVGERRAGLLPHPDRRREGQRPVVHDAQGRHGERRSRSTSR